MCLAGAATAIYDLVINIANLWQDANVDKGPEKFLEILLPF
jgi:hypothetical protein